MLNVKYGEMHYNIAKIISPINIILVNKKTKALPLKTREFMEAQQLKCLKNIHSYAVSKTYHPLTHLYILFHNNSSTLVPNNALAYVNKNQFTYPFQRFKARKLKRKG